MLRPSYKCYVVEYCVATTLLTTPIKHIHDFCPHQNCEMTIMHAPILTKQDKIFSNNQ